MDLLVVCNILHFVFAGMAGGGGSRSGGFVHEGVSMRKWKSWVCSVW